MIWQLIPILCLAMFAQYEGRAVSEQKIKINHDKEEKPHEEYAWAYPSYEFHYNVDDEHTHDIKGQEESRDGSEVKGEYWLVEPDGRKRVVKYHADKHKGFVAHVEYSAPHHHSTKHSSESGEREE